VPYVTLRRRMRLRLCLSISNLVISPNLAYNLPSNVLSVSSIDSRYIINRLQSGYIIPQDNQEIAREAEHQYNATCVVIYVTWMVTYSRIRCC